MAFERIHCRSRSSRCEEPRASFYPLSKEKKVFLAFNAAATQRYGLDRYTHVVTYYDPEARSVGFRFTSKEEPGALRVNRQPGYVTIGIASVLKSKALQPKLPHYPIDTFETREGTLLAILLDGKGTER